VLAALDDFRPSAVQEDDEGSGLRVFFPTGDARDQALAALGGMFRAGGIAMEPVEVPDQDWAARSQAGLGAVTVGRLVIAPPWDSAAESAHAARHVLVVEPSMGFGTGHHASTRLCLLALQTLDPRGTWALDLGTGSGVLAMAAVRLGATRAIGIDTDPDALACARANCGRNGMAETVELRLADFRTLPGPPAPIVLANLSGAVLAGWAPQLADLVQPHGYLIAGGFTAVEPAVLPALEAVLSLIRLDREDEWCAAVLQRG
jgi:ribosomal protein L11 methyltransferase